MNLFFCESSNENIGFLNLKEKYTDSLKQVKLDAFDCNVIDDNGALFGRCENDDYLLLYIGCITNIPLPGSKKSSDSPYAVAAFLLSAFEASNKFFLDGLSGDYSVAVISKTENKVFLANDPSGNRPVFYKIRNGHVSFSSQIYPFGKAANIDRSNEAFLLGYEFIPGQATFYQDVKKIPNGQILELYNGKEKRHSHITPLRHKETQFFTEKQLIQELYDIFMGVLEEQVQTGKNSAVIMGGVDSALIASALKRLGFDVTSYTFRFQDSKYNQPNIKYFSRYLGHKHKWIDINKSVLKNGLLKYPLMFNNIASQPHYLVQTAHVAKAIRKDGFIHAFTGDGCDGIFQGYPTVHLRTKLLDHVSLLPDTLLNIFVALLGLPAIESMFGHPLRILRNALKIATRTHPMRSYVAARIFDEAALQQLYAQNWPVDVQNQVESILKDLSSGLDDLSAMKLAFLGKGLVGLNKNKLDGSSKYSGVALVTPYSHPMLVKFADSLPEHFLRPKSNHTLLGQGKYIFFKMVKEKQLLPDRILYQAKKSPVNAPVDNWYINQLSDMMLDSIKTLPFASNSTYVRGLVPDRIWENLYRKLKPIDSYASHGLCLLYTYSQFFR